MEYYRSNVAGGIVPNHNDANNTLLIPTNESYASSYWNMPYTDNGISPMKQIEGKLKLFSLGKTIGNIEFYFSFFDEK